MSTTEYATEPTRIRVYPDEGHYFIDAVDDEGLFSEAVWDAYEGSPMDRDTATRVAPEFATAHGWSDLPITFD